jgi:hypothetical protein
MNDGASCFTEVCLFTDILVKQVLRPLHRLLRDVIPTVRVAPTLPVKTCGILGKFRKSVSVVGYLAPSCSIWQSILRCQPVSGTNPILIFKELMVVT